MDGGPVYRTTNADPRPVCGAEVGQPCDLQPGQSAGYSERFHLELIDPTSEPIGRAVVRTGSRVATFRSL